MLIRNEAYISAQHSNMLLINLQLTLYRIFELGDLDSMYVIQWYLQHGANILDVANITICHGGAHLHSFCNLSLYIHSPLWFP